MSIAVKNLLKNYGAQKAVDDISFNVEKGEIVGFLGPNGAGKSTTMKIVTGYLQPDAGQATVCGVDVQKAPLESKRKIGYLPESNPLYYEMYIREYLDFVADVHAVQGKKKKIEEVIETVGLAPENKKRVGQLSKGYKQRVGLAAALIHSPEVLILDEPTTGLDPNQIIEIREVIKNLGKDKTVLFSSHILQEVEAICDRVIIINKGKLVANDKLSNLQKQMSSNAIVQLELKEKVDAGLMHAVFQSQVQQINNTTWLFNTSDPEKLKKQILELSLQNNLNIVSLQTNEQRLEEIFRTLTQEIK